MSLHLSSPAQSGSSSSRLPDSPSGQGLPERGRARALMYLCHQPHRTLLGHPYSGASRTQGNNWPQSPFSHPWAIPDQLLGRFSPMPASCTSDTCLVPVYSCLSGWPMSPQNVGVTATLITATDTSLAHTERVWLEQLSCPPGFIPSCTSSQHQPGPPAILL